MTKEAIKRKEWVKPEVRRIGKITDVADDPGGGPQTSANQS